MSKFQCGRLITKDEQFKAFKDRNPEWLSTAVNNDEDFSFLLLPLFIRKPESLENVKNFFELWEWAIVRSDIGLSPTEWTTRIIISISASFLVSDARICIRSFLEHLTVAGVLITEISDESFEGVIEFVNSTIFDTFIEADTQMWLKLYQRTLKSKTRLFIRFSDMMKMAKEARQLTLIEDLGMVMINSADFINNKSGFPVMSKASQLVLQELFKVKESLVNVDE
jgi:hypothetical protein